MTNHSIPHEQPTTRRWPLVVGAAALFFTGLGVGVASDNDVAGTATVEVTPQACLDAVKAADAVIELNIEAFDYVVDAFDAAANFDVAGIDQATVGIESLHAPMGVAADEYRTTSDECRGERS